MDDYSGELIPSSRGADVTDPYGSMAPVKRQTYKRKGLPGEFNWASTDEGTKFYGKIGSPMAKFQTPLGHTVTAAPKAAPRFEGFLKDLDARGYHAKDCDALCIRQKRGGTSMSIHSWGAAMDVDPDVNPFQPGSSHPWTVFPENVEALAWKWGLSWGARFGDTMHFEAGSPQWWKGRLTWLVSKNYMAQAQMDEIVKQYGL